MHDVFGGLHIIVQEFWVDLLLVHVTGGERLSYGETSSGTFSFVNSGRNDLQQILAVIVFVVIWPLQPRHLLSCRQS